MVSDTFLKQKLIRSFESCVCLFILRVSWWLAEGASICSSCGPWPPWVLDGTSRACGCLGARSQLLLHGHLAHGRLADSRTKFGRLPRRTSEPVAWFGQDLLLLPAIIAHPDHLGEQGRGRRLQSSPSLIHNDLKYRHVPVS